MYNLIFVYKLSIATNDLLRVKKQWSSTLIYKTDQSFPFFDSDFDKFYNSAVLLFASLTIVIENLTLSFREVLLSGSPMCAPGTPASTLDLFFLPSVWDKFLKFSDLLLRSGTYQLSCGWEVFSWQH